MGHTNTLTAKPRTKATPVASRIARGSVDVRGGNMNFEYKDMFSLTSVERIEVVKQGVPSLWLNKISADMVVPKDRLFHWLGIPRATANRKVKSGDALDRQQSEPTLGMARLVGLVQNVVEQSGNVEGFDAARWTAEFLERPNPALGGKLPGDFMDTADGRGLVESLILQQQAGTYA